MFDLKQQVRGEARIATSLLDQDFYKFTMGHFITRFRPGVRVRFKLINRHWHIPLARIIDEEELRLELDHARTLRFSADELRYVNDTELYGERMFPLSYIGFLDRLALPAYRLERIGDQFKLHLECAWEDVTWWETTVLAIISELLYRTLMREMPDEDVAVMFGRAKDKAVAKFRRIAGQPSVTVADFGFRRRFSGAWQREMLTIAAEVLGPQLSGTSNVLLARDLGLMPVGTNAHELPMVFTALADSPDAKVGAQYDVVRKWGELFKGGLRVLLPDTYGSFQFFARMPDDLAVEVAHSWRGIRIDSGDPFSEAFNFASWLRAHDVDPVGEGKVAIPSDGLDIHTMLELDQRLMGIIPHPFGWGTTLTNDFVGCHPRGNEHAVVRGNELELTYDELFRGHSIVCKVDLVDGSRPAVKLSNNYDKATGPVDEVFRYSQIFGCVGRIKQKVIV